MEDEKIFIAEAVVLLKQLTTKLQELNASYDTSPEELIRTFEKISKLAKDGAYWSAYVSKR
jgi:hypothetical protein